MLTVCVAAVSGDSQAAAMRTLVESLPEENYASLRYLITFLAQVQVTARIDDIIQPVRHLQCVCMCVCAGVSQQRGEQDDQQ